MAALSIRARLSVSRIGDRFRTWRNHLLADARFQRWAAGSPLTRKFAQRRARALFNLCAGFVYSQILFACVKLDVFELLRAGPRDCQALAPRMGLTVAAAQRLLMGAASLGLLRALPGDRFALDDLGASMLGNPAIAAFVAHHDLLYADLGDPVGLLRGEAETRVSRFWPYASRRPDGGSEAVDAPGVGGEVYGAYSDLMSQTQNLVIEEILDAYPFARHRRLLDVGGGEGAFVAAATKRAPHLELELFDLPPVAARAGAKLAALGLSDRIKATGGDCLSDPLPRGADIVSLVRVLHDHDDESALVLLSAAHDALPRGGAVVVAEPMARERGAEPMGDAYFGFYLLAMGRGRPRSSGEIAALLHKAGFDRARILKTRNPLLVSALAARRM
jgi:demethylspheroidene O-methyltransferase